MLSLDFPFNYSTRKGVIYNFSITFTPTRTYSYLNQLVAQKIEDEVRSVGRSGAWYSVLPSNLLSKVTPVKLLYLPGSQMRPFWHHMKLSSSMVHAGSRCHAWGPDPSLTSQPRPNRFRCPLPTSHQATSPLPSTTRMPPLSRKTRRREAFVSQLDYNLKPGLGSPGSEILTTLADILSKWIQDCFTPSESTMF